MISANHRFDSLSITDHDSVLKALSVIFAVLSAWSTCSIVLLVLLSRLDLILLLLCNSVRFQLRILISAHHRFDSFSISDHDSILKAFPMIFCCLSAQSTHSLDEVLLLIY